MRVVVDSQEHCYELDQEYLNQLQSTANSTQLEPGTYVIRIERGAFSYGPEQQQVTPEPWVMLWIYGGTFVNRKTNVKVGATWSSLNGYDDTLTLDVLEKTTVCGVFFDTYKKDYSGDITLSILKDR
ncbi:hypothetical protein [Leptothoe kymatousa]|uniref:Uncharacterized protein n=1 Tax=Leptothoe kymatousa TAU-MAC 1615 TaxID=2364775 RepID=A0ABS5Y5T0_9CYAN|nr:hypothetical protein [Leptothoe kymatousa]MBT9313175.1 hypothetical protein [Leptothoe kymatousa TAU-MAC 1615]